MSSYRFLLASCVLQLASLLLSTETARAQSAPTMDLSFSLPEAVRTGQVVVAADTFQLEVGATVAGSLDTVMTHMSPLPLIGVGGSLPTVYTVGGASLTLARINGDLYSEGFVLGVLSNVTGSIYYGPLGERETPTVHVEYPPTSGGNVSAWAWFSTVNLAPGRYNDVAVSLGATLRLRSGVYYLNSLLATSGGNIVVDTSAGPVEIYITTGMSVTGNVEGDASKILVGYNGSFPARISGNFKGTVLAPNAALTVTGGWFQRQVGAFFARSVVLTALSRIEHVPSEVFGPTIISRISTAWSDVLGYDPGFYGCAPPIDLPATIQVDPITGREYFGNLSYPLAPTPCQSAITSCDEFDNPIPRPTVAQLNAPPPVGERCEAVGTAIAASDCRIDPTTVTRLCSAGCAADEVCGTMCTDDACTATARYCGKLYESCAPLPESDGDCETYYQCPDPRAVQSQDLAADRAAHPPRTEPSPTAEPAERVAVASYALLDAMCDTAPAPVEPSAKEEDGDNLDFGNDQWGVKLDISQDLGFGMGSMGKVLESGDVTANAGVDVSVEARVMGSKVDVFTATGGVEKDKCGWRFASDVFVFGDSIASYDTTAGASSGLPPLGPDRETPDVDRNRCESTYEDRREKAGGVRHANFLVRTIIDNYDSNGLSEYTCARANEELGGSWNCAMAPFRTDEAPDIIEEWKEHYHREAERYVAVDGAFEGEESSLSASGQLTLFDIRQAYTLIAGSATIPLGPVSLVLAAEAFGFWEVSGALHAHATYGLGYGDFWDGEAGDIGEPTFPETLERDARIAVGPMVIPGVGVTILAYVGVGLGPVSVGIEGQVDLVHISFPASLMGSLGRVSVPRADVAPLWEGDPIPGMDYATVYDWRYNLVGKVGLQLGVLNGRINLAARVDLWFWSKTWRIKIANLVGYNEYFPIVEGTLGAPVATASDFGTEGDDVEYTIIPAGTAYVEPDPMADLFEPPIYADECIVPPDHP